MSNTEGRHPSVVAAARWLADWEHLPDWEQPIARIFADALDDLLELVPTDDPQLTNAINALITAKDAAVRAKIVSLEQDADRESVG